MLLGDCLWLNDTHNVGYPDADRRVLRFECLRHENLSKCVTFLNVHFQMVIPQHQPCAITNPWETHTIHVKVLIDSLNNKALESVAYLSDLGQKSPKTRVSADCHVWFLSYSLVDSDSRQWLETASHPIQIKSNQQCIGVVSICLIIIDPILEGATESHFGRISQSATKNGLVT